MTYCESASSANTCGVSLIGEINEILLSSTASIYIQFRDNLCKDTARAGESARVKGNGFLLTSPTRPTEADPLQSDRNLTPYTGMVPLYGWGLTVAPEDRELLHRGRMPICGSRW
jgi:hypothetical protein